MTCRSRATCGSFASLQQLPCDFDQKQRENEPWWLFSCTPLRARSDSYIHRLWKCTACTWKTLSVPASCDFVRELDDPAPVSLCFMLRPEGWLLHVARGSPHTEMDFSQNTILLLYVLFMIKVGYALFYFISTNTGRIQVTCPKWH